MLNGFLVTSHGYVTAYNIIAMYYAPSYFHRETRPERRRRIINNICTYIYAYVAGRQFFRLAGTRISGDPNEYTYTRTKWVLVIRFFLQLYNNNNNRLHWRYRLHNSQGGVYRYVCARQQLFFQLIFCKTAIILIFIII